MENETIIYKKNKVYYFILIIYLLVFQDLLQQYISVMQYFDEILAIILIPIMIFNCIKNKTLKISKYNLYIVVCLIIITIIGLLGNVIYKYQSYIAIFTDVLLIWKFFLVYFLFEKINKTKQLDNNKKIILKHIKIITIILFVFTIMNYVLKIFPSEYRYGIMTNQLFYSHTTYLASSSIFLLVLYIRFSKKINSLYSYILLFIIISTIRTKAIVFVIIFLLLGNYLNISNKKIKINKIILFAIIAFFIGFQQIEFYFFEETDSARNVLLRTSIEIANDYFPIGTGFGTYGSYVSGQEYSPVYNIYKINNIWGIQRSNPSFISDSFWPMLLGQFGYIGMGVYILIIIIIFIKIQHGYKIENKAIYISKITALVYLLISSTSESAFVNPMAIALAITIAI